MARILVADDEPGLREFITDALELDDYLNPDAVTFVEWAEPALGLIKTPTCVHISHQTPTTRRVSVAGPAAERLFLC